MQMFTWKKKTKENKNLLALERKLHYKVGSQVTGSRNACYIDKLIY